MRPPLKCAPAALAVAVGGGAPRSDSPEAILERAATRAREAGAPYAGMVTPDEAQRLASAGARIVDVRTRPEWELVGHVPGSALVEWQRYPDGARNEQFLDELAEVVDPDDTVLFLCRSGQRSHHAAAAAAGAGYARAFNILEGFEGDRDPDGHRGALGGWRKRGLPWVQS
jgi:rhodanese-related sulfurtransferase